MITRASHFRHAPRGGCYQEERSPLSLSAKFLAQNYAITGPVSLPIEATDHTGIASRQREALGHIIGPANPKSM